MSPANETIGIMVPGDGRVRFCSTPLADLRGGEWVVASGPFGDEPGQVLFGAQRVASPNRLPAAFVAPRRLTPLEREQIPALIRRVTESFDAVRAVLLQLDPEAEISSLRLSLDGSTLLLRVFGTTGDRSASLVETLSRRLGISVNVEWTDRPAHTFGSLGHVDSADDERALVLARLKIDEVASTSFPNGWPRLGQVVGTPQGPGRLRSVSVRHNSATIRLDSGDQIELPVVELSAPEG